MGDLGGMPAGSWGNFWGGFWRRGCIGIGDFFLFLSMELWDIDRFEGLVDQG